MEQSCKENTFGTHTWLLGPMVHNHHISVYVQQTFKFIYTL